MGEESLSRMQHSVSVPLLQDKSIELKDFSVFGASGVAREEALHHLDVDHEPRTTRRLAGLFGKSPRELHSEYASISLHQAARDGRLDLVEKKLQLLGRNSEKISTQDKDGSTALHYAIRYNHLKIVKKLVQWGASVAARGENGATPLHFAARLHVSQNHTLSDSASATPTPEQTPKMAKRQLEASTSGESSKKTLDKGTSSCSHKNYLKPNAFGLRKRDSSGLERKLLKNSREMLFREDSIILFLLSRKAHVNSRDNYGSTPLHYAASKCNESAVFQLLTDKNIDLEAKDKTEMTALHCAAMEGSVKVAKVLVEAGASLRCFDEEGMTPLHFAAMEGSLEVAKYLFEAAEEKGGWETLSKMVLDQDREEQTALHLAVENGHFEIVRLLIEKGTNVNCVKANLVSPLHLATTNGHLAIVKLLLNHDADIEAKTAMQRTPLMRAATFNRLEIMQYLWLKGAKLECRDRDKNTPLIISAKKNHVEAVRFLLKHGADPSAKDKNDRNIYHYSAAEGCMDTLKYILTDKKAKTLLNEPDKFEDTPLHLAASRGFDDIVKILLENGATIDAKNDQDLTPLHLAAKHGRTRVTMALIKQDPSIINDEDDRSNTPLHLAASHGHIRVVELLLNQGASIDARNTSLWTPLDCAAAEGWTKTATVLLNKGSPVDPMDKTKTTPLHLACREGHADMVKLLLSRKADLALTDHEGKNCLDIAIDHGQKDVVLEILNHPHWKRVMRNPTTEGASVTTPMRKLIKKLPDLAMKVCDRCFRAREAVNHLEYNITLNYEFLDDINTEWFDDDSADLTIADDGHAMEDIVYKIRKALPENSTRQLQMKHNHPLILMVTHEREKLLKHPLVTFLLRHKWRRYGRYVYYASFTFYLIFLLFLTGYALVTSEKVPPGSCVAPQCNCSHFKRIRAEAPFEFFWIRFGGNIVLILAVLVLIIKFFKAVCLRRLFLTWHELVELGTYTSAIIFVKHDSGGSHTTSCFYAHNSIGAASLCLAWFTLVLSMRKFPKLGIYVVMFTEMFRTFAQFFVVLLLFIVAFGLGFHVLLYTQVPFSTPGRSMLKTAMGMLGEYEYDTVYNESEVPPIAWAVYICFLVINCVIIVNLLIGLAVDDIKGVQEKAALKRLAMQVDLALDVEKVLPFFLRKKLMTMTETVYPNKERYRSIWSFWHQTLTTPAQVINDALYPARSPIERVQKQQELFQHDVTKMKTRLKTLQTRTVRLEAMMKAMLRHHGIKLKPEIDEDDAELKWDSSDDEERYAL